MHEPPRAPTSSERIRELVTRLSGFDRWLPWFSLVLSVAGAALMDRSEEQAGLIAVIAGGSWLALIAFLVLHREGQSARPVQLRQRLLRFGSAAVSQSLAQSALFFGGPFYWEACAWTPAQTVFAGLFAAAVAVSLWDPWCYWALAHPLAGPCLMGFASFTATHAVLPMLGMPHRVSVWLSAGAVGGLMLISSLASRNPKAPRDAAIVALSLVALLLIGGLRALPPAPLRLAQKAMARDVVDRLPVDAAQVFHERPGRLVCWTAIAAPHGLREPLFHVWSRDGEELSRLRLHVRGGRRAGFRTWSRHAAHARGHYRCQVETTLGQTLGVVEAVVGARVRR